MTVGASAVRPPRATRPAVRLYLLHHAGGSRAIFRGWPGLFPADWETIPVNAPGRRAGDQRRTLSDFVESLLEQIPRDGVPYAVFGHSMGALAAFALALAAQAVDRESPAWLGLSAHPGLLVTGHPDGHLHRLPAEGLREAMVGLGGTAAEILGDDRIWAWLEPMMRRDLLMAETWLPPTSVPVIRVPVTAYCGQDDKLAAPATARAWAAHTERFLGVRVFPGGHFYLQPARERVAQAIAADVLDVLSELQGAALA